jgi:type II secretory pathway pseudopilin PulG
MMEVVRVCTMKTLLRFTGAGDRKNPAAGERSFVPAMWEKPSERGIVRKGQRMQRESAPLPLKISFTTSGSRERHAGFSLLELLMVINIMAWMAWASITALWGISGGIAMNRKVSDMQSILELARSQAMQLNTYVYVGFFESDGMKASGKLPVTSGVGKIWIGTVATKDGTAGYNPSDPSSVISPSNLMPIGKLQQMENLHLDQSLPFGHAAMLTNSMVVGVAPVNAPFGWPVNTKATIPGFTVAVIRFDPRGSATIPGSQALPEALQIALRPSKGGMVAVNSMDTAVVQVDAINGIVKALRPSP